VRSIAVLEHVFDLDDSLRELARVMKPGALAVHGIHLFTSLSGGHDRAWAAPDLRPPADVRPWEHLRTGRSPSMEILNRKREAEYRESFLRYYDVIEWRRAREGEKILTPEIRRELSDYSEEELLTRAITVVARPRAR
jgi:SAM-dependent methyltransferase